MARVISIDPVTRIEGHLKIEVEVENGEVVDARSCGTMFRGFEMILKDRDPRDAQHLTQRICGVCPASHGLAASLCLEDAFGVTPPENARITRNLVLGANFIQSHVLHFYHLAALDYVVGPDAAPFIPRYKGDYRLPKKVNDAAVEHYLEALEMRRKAQEMLAIFGGKMPCHMTYVPGGITEEISADKVTSFLWRLKELRAFIENVYVPDVLAIGEVYSDYKEIGVGYKDLLDYGVFDLDETGERKLFKRGTFMNGKDGSMDPEKIAEQVRHSRYAAETANKNPKEGETTPHPEKEGAYSWLKSPRYDDIPCELGPLARMWVNGDYREGVSVIDRHAARALECKKIARAMEQWCLELKPGEKVYNECEVPEKATGVGLTGAPRGSLGHWISISNGKIANYQVITPTNWNFSPRDDADRMGPAEKALIGTPVADANNPVEVLRVVRSYDPCLACSVHVISPSGSSKISVAHHH